MKSILSNSKIIYLLTPFKQKLELSVLFLPHTGTMASSMQLSYFQLLQAINIPIVAGHALDAADKKTIQDICDYLETQDVSEHEDCFILEGEIDSLIKKLVENENLRVKTKTSYVPPSISDEVLHLTPSWIINDSGLALFVAKNKYHLPVLSSLTPFCFDGIDTFYFTQSSIPKHKLKKLLNTGGVTQAQAALLSKEINSWGLDIPTPPSNEPILLPDVNPVGYLCVCKEEEDIFTPTPQTYLTLNYGYGDYLVRGQENPCIVNKEGKWAKINRKLNKEMLLAHALTRFGFFEQPKKNSHAELRYYPTKAVDWNYFLTKGVSFLKKMGWIVEIEKSAFDDIQEISSLIIETTSVDNNWFELDISFEIDGITHNLVEMLGVLFKKEPRWLNQAAVESIEDDEIVILKLSTGKSVQIKASAIKPLALNILDFFDNPTAPINIKDAIRFKAALEPHLAPNAKFFEDIVEKAKTFSDITLIDTKEIPVLATLRDYQIYGISWLQHMLQHGFGALLADDRGLGKTLQSIAHLALEHLNKEQNMRSLIVVETALMEKWNTEFSKYCPNLNIKTAYGKDVVSALEDNSAHIIITTYTSLKQKLSQFNAYNWHILVMDEAQNAKNAKTQNVQALNSLNCTQKICVSGTPIENNLSELWSLFSFIFPGYLGTYKEFVKYWQRPIENDNNTVKQQILAEKCAPFILYRKKKNVAPELLEKIIVIEKIPLGKEQATLYNSIHAAMNQKVLETIQDIGLKKSNIIILDALLKLRQICCDPLLMNKSGDSAKKQKVLDLACQYKREGKKLLIFSQFKSMLELLMPALDSLGISHTSITGEVKKRQERVDSFEQGDYDTMLITLKAGGKGLDIYAADGVVIYDPWWNPAAEEQAADRAHRLGQTKQITVHKLICENTIEEKILLLQERKSSLSASILEKAVTGDSVKISTNDLLNLLALNESSILNEPANSAENQK